MKFLPGQYALLSVPGVDGARAYSMCNVTESGEEWHFEIKRVPNGACTSAMFANLKVGDSIGLDFTNALTEYVGAITFTLKAS